MDDLIKILIVEDEMIIGAKLSMHLTQLGYQVTAILPRGEEALSHVKENQPDIILLDIRLRGKMDGIETAMQIEQHFQTPVIYLTANADDATFKRARATKPAAFITKPYKQLDLQRAIELTISRMANSENAFMPETNNRNEDPFILNDRIFVRHKDKMVKIMLADVLYIEAERNYSCIFTAAKEYVVPVTLKVIENKFPANLFKRIHRSYVISLKHIDAVAEDHVVIAQKPIPISETMKVHLLQHIQKI